MASSYQIRLNDERIVGDNSYLNYSGGDRALLKIVTSHTSGRKILVVKDSFGNAFVPYLANHYDEIYVVDPRYYRRSLKMCIRDRLIAVQPTRGLDVGAIEYIHKRLIEQRDNGKAVLLISLELDEILRLSDRIAVLNNGEIVGLVQGADTNENEIGLMMAGVKRGNTA